MLRFPGPNKQDRPRNSTGLVRVFELARAAFHSSQHPTVVTQEFNDILDLHAASIRLCYEVGRP